MAKGRAVSKTRTKDEAPCVKCDNCDRLVYKDETPFPDLDAAKEAEFRCSICQKMDDLEERLTSRHKRACEVLQAKLIRLENSVHSMTKQLQQLQAQQQQPPGSSPSRMWRTMICRDSLGTRRKQCLLIISRELLRRRHIPWILQISPAVDNKRGEQAASTQLTTEGQSETTQIEDGVLQ
ncbi:hypothetical protein MRX96_022348 [Rhipicephalus microplus]